MNTERGLSLLVLSNGFLLAVNLIAVSALYDQIQHKTIIDRRKCLLPPRALLHLHLCIILAFSFLYILTRVWMPGLLTDWLTDWLTDCLTVWLSDCLTDWLTDWPTDWQTYKLNEQIDNTTTVPLETEYLYFPSWSRNFWTFDFMAVNSS